MSVFNKGVFSYLTEKGVLDYSVHLWSLDETVFLILHVKTFRKTNSELVSL